MPLIKRVHHAYLFSNGKIRALDAQQKEIPDLQGTYSLEKHKQILLEAADDCNFLNFDILPNGFINNCVEFAKHYREKNFSWDEIQQEIKTEAQ